MFSEIDVWKFESSEIYSLVAIKFASSLFVCLFGEGARARLTVSVISFMEIDLVSTRHVI